MHIASHRTAKRQTLEDLYIVSLSTALSLSTVTNRPTVLSVTTASSLHVCRPEPDHCHKPVGLYCCGPPPVHPAVMQAYMTYVRACQIQHRIAGQF